MFISNQGFVVACVMLVCLPLRTIASSVLPMSLDQMADAAAQVIDGVVESTTSQWTSDHTTIRTTVHFKNVRYLKGRRADSNDSFDLVVPGGEVDHIQLRLTGAPTFCVGERWVLFLHPTYNVYPVVGLSHGAFRVEENPSGTDHVRDAMGRAITGISSRGFVTKAAAPSERARPSPVFSAMSGAIKSVSARTMAGKPPIEHEQFLAILEPILQNSEHYDLKGPAGRPTGRRARTVPLRSRSSRRPDGLSQPHNRVRVHESVDSQPSRRMRGDHHE